jgi:hypothetical protein
MTFWEAVSFVHPTAEKVQTPIFTSQMAAIEPNKQFGHFLFYEICFVTLGHFLFASVLLPRESIHYVVEHFE